MDLAVFTDQLNILLANYSTDECLPSVCELLRMHSNANVLLQDQAGGIITHQLLDGEEKGGSIPDSASCLTLPIYRQDIKIGVLTLYRKGLLFDETEKLSASVALAVCSILIRHNRERIEMERARRVESVKAVINSLSFSELEAVVHVFHALGGGEGLLVAGRIADQMGVTRSVVVNALRKLEGTGVIETRSLGMKGTYIRVLNPVLVEELRKLRK